MLSVRLRTIPNDHDRPVQARSPPRLSAYPSINQFVQLPIIGAVPRRRVRSSNQRRVGVRQSFACGIFR